MKVVRSVTAKALREYRSNHRKSLRGSLPRALCRPTLRGDTDSDEDEKLLILGNSRRTEREH